MPRPTVTVEPLGQDILAMVQCIAIDADVFPYPSADFTSRSLHDRVWIARDGDRRVMAFLAARLHRGVLHVQGVAVEPSARRQGMGRALVRACLASDEAASRPVDLAVSVENEAAIALYESEGFAVVARAPDYYRSGTYGWQRDAFVMRRSPRRRKSR